MLKRQKEIPPEFQSIKPFKMYKTWNLSTGSYSTVDSASGDISVYNAVQNYNLNSYGDDSVAISSASIWYSIRNMFYGKFYASGSGSVLDIYGGSTEPAYSDEFTYKNLSGDAVVFSIPRSKIGEGIIKSSLTLYNSCAGDSVTIIDDSNGNLIDSSGKYSTSYIGNISYSRGLIIITDSQYYNYFSSSLFGSASYVHGNLTFTSYYTSYQYEYVCHVKSHEFNNTENPTAFVYDSTGYKSFRFDKLLDSSGSEVMFKPFTTGIALYDETNNIIALSKFAKPIRIEDDMDSVFMIRFDA